jgi:anaerobic selenocysteine-containing dehydrogenase
MPLAGGDLPLDGTADDEMMLDLAYAQGRMPMDEIRQLRGTIQRDREIVVLPPDDRPHARFAIAPPDVVAELAVVARERTAAEVIDGFEPQRYPFRLTSRRLKHVLNSLGREIPGLARVGTTNEAYLHPDDLAVIGAAPGDLVEITSPSGSIVGVAAASASIKRGVVSMAHSWGGAVTDDEVRTQGSPTNRLCTVDSGHDPLNGMAVQSAIPVAVTRFTSN